LEEKIKNGYTIWKEWTVKEMFMNTPEGKRPVGKPRKRC
jgi:hypothetical protein